MGTFLQSYGRGYIAREGDQYQYVENEKVVGTYDSVDELVKANSDDGKQDKQSTATAGATDVAEASAPKKTRSRKTAAA